MVMETTLQLSAKHIHYIAKIQQTQEAFSSVIP